MKRLAELMHTYRYSPEFVQEFFSLGQAGADIYLQWGRSKSQERGPKLLKQRNISRKLEEEV
jgi:hypothetical protein